MYTEAFEKAETIEELASNCLPFHATFQAMKLTSVDIMEEMNSVIHSPEKDCDHVVATFFHNGNFETVFNLNDLGYRKLYESFQKVIESASLIENYVKEVKEAFA